MILLFVALVVGVVVAAYIYRDAIFPSLKGWRTVILNAVSAGAILSVDLVGYLAGFSWDGILSAQAALWVTLLLNLANIALRFATNTPVGSKEPAP